MLLPDTVAAFITEDLTGQVIPVKLYWQITFVTEGQGLVTRRLEAVIVATRLVLWAGLGQFAQGFLQFVAMVAREG